MHKITPQEALQRTIEHREIFHDEMLHLMRMVMSGELSPVMTAALITGLRHRKVMAEFFGTLGHHAGSGLIAAALLILYVFNRVVGSSRFWRATLGDGFSPDVPDICKSYLELLACYLIFLGTLGYALTLARRNP